MATKKKEPGKAKRYDRLFLVFDSFDEIEDCSGVYSDPNVVKDWNYHFVLYVPNDSAAKRGVCLGEITVLK